MKTYVNEQLVVCNFDIVGKGVQLLSYSSVVTYKMHCYLFGSLDIFKGHTKIFGSTISGFKAKMYSITLNYELLYI